MKSGSVCIGSFVFSLGLARDGRRRRLGLVVALNAPVFPAARRSTPSRPPWGHNTSVSGPHAGALPAWARQTGLFHSQGILLHHKKADAPTESTVTFPLAIQHTHTRLSKPEELRKLHLQHHRTSKK